MGFSLSLLADPETLRMLGLGVSTTLRLFIGALVCGFLIALLISSFYVVPSKITRGIISLFVEYHRNVPTVVQIMV